MHSVRPRPVCDQLGGRRLTQFAFVNRPLELNQEDRPELVFLGMRQAIRMVELLLAKPNIFANLQLMGIAGIRVAREPRARIAAWRRAP